MEAEFKTTLALGLYIKIINGNWIYDNFGSWTVHQNDKWKLWLWLLDCASKWQMETVTLASGLCIKMTNGNCDFGFWTVHQNDKWKLWLWLLDCTSKWQMETVTWASGLYIKMTNGNCDLGFWTVHQNDKWKLWLGLLDCILEWSPTFSVCYVLLLITDTGIWIDKISNYLNI